MCFVRCAVFPGFGNMSGAVSGVLESLTRRNGVKVASALNIEECCLAAGEVVGYDAVLSASRMNNAIVMFMSTVEKANELVERGLVINDAFTVVLPLSMPSKRVTLSNVPPFVKDEFLVNMLSRYGKLVSPIKRIPLGNVSPLLKHVVSFRRYAYMVIKDNAELEVSFNFRMDDFDYLIYATTDKMRCFGCGRVGHLVRTCPDKGEKDEEVRPQTSVEALVETEGSRARLNVSKVAEKEPDVEVAVDKSVSETVESRLSGSEEPMEEMTVLVEGELQNSSRSTNCEKKTSEVVSDISLTETGDSQSFKVPLKRKMKSHSSLRMVKKAGTNELSNGEEDESDEDSSDSSSVYSQSDYSFRGYDVQDIKQFLRITKNKRNVNVEKHFPNAQLFVERSRSLMSEGSFTDREVYRLKKIVRKISMEVGSNDGV